LIRLCRYESAAARSKGPLPFARSVAKELAARGRERVGLGALRNLAGSRAKCLEAVLGVDREQLLDVDAGDVDGPWVSDQRHG
jgi:hypothetical protein